MSKDAKRRLFEYWAESKFFDLDRIGEDLYESAETRAAWAGFQAALEFKGPDVLGEVKLPEFTWNLPSDLEELPYDFDLVYDIKHPHELRVAVTRNLDIFLMCLDYDYVRLDKPKRS